MQELGTADDDGQITWKQQLCLNHVRLRSTSVAVLEVNRKGSAASAAEQQQVDTGSVEVIAWASTKIIQVCAMSWGAVCCHSKQEHKISAMQTPDCMLVSAMHTVNDMQCNTRQTECTHFHQRRLPHHDSMHADDMFISILLMAVPLLVLQGCSGLGVVDADERDKALLSVVVCSWCCSFRNPSLFPNHIRSMLSFLAMQGSVSCLICCHCHGGCAAPTVLRAQVNSVQKHVGHCVQSCVVDAAATTVCVSACCVLCVNPPSLVSGASFADALP